MLYKHYYRNTFIAKTSRSCNGTAVGVKRNKPKGETMIKNKPEQNKIKNIYATEKINS